MTMKRTTEIGNVKVFAQDGTELGKVLKWQFSVRNKFSFVWNWLITIKNK